MIQPLSPFCPPYFLHEKVIQNLSKGHYWELLTGTSKERKVIKRIGVIVVSNHQVLFNGGKGSLPSIIRDCFSEGQRSTFLKSESLHDWKTLISKMVQ